MRASGVSPSAFGPVRRSSPARAAAPSLMPEALPAVTLPSLSNAGFRPASASASCLRLMNSSLAKTTGSPLRCGIDHRNDLVLERPAFCAASAFFCERQRELVLLRAR